MSFEKQSGYFESFDGSSIYYEVRGKGQPIFLLYGIVCTANHWRHQIRYFSEHYQTIIMDYRGHQNTPVPLDRDTLSLDSLAQDIKGLANHLGIQKASFWGHSFGAQVLIRTYDMFPELFSNIVFINGFATNPISAGPLGAEGALSAFRWFKYGFEQLPETLSYIWKFAVNNPLAQQISALAGGFNLSLTGIKDVEIYSKGVASVELDVFLKFFEQMMNYDGNSVLSRIEVPTLIIAGSKDSVTPLSFQENIHKKIKSSELLVVPYGSHCTQLDMPEFVNTKIELFLRNLKY